ncbi:hypothetical protein JYQ62_23625 [Nostoc sp. UHCC 0702]|nr:hypothetical protein JYQ62_23625 [Nostoc sp. UHCC 0702]
MKKFSSAIFSVGFTVLSLGTWVSFANSANADSVRGDYRRNGTYTRPNYPLDRGYRYYNRYPVNRPNYRLDRGYRYYNRYPVNRPDYRLDRGYRYYNQLPETRLFPASPPPLIVPPPNYPSSVTIPPASFPSPVTIPPANFP